MLLFEVASLNWAMDSDAAENPRALEDEQFVILNCNIRDVLSNMKPDVRLDPDHVNGGENAIGDRLAKATDHFKRGGNMDLPAVGASEYHDHVSVDNGRHRMVAALRLGHEFIPMLVWIENLDKFKELVKTKPVR